MQDIEDYNKKVAAQNPDLIGSTFMSNACGKFEVIRRVGTDRHHAALYEIKFDTEYKTTAIKCAIMDGRIKDYLYPSICNIGYLGATLPEISNYIYDLLTTNNKYSELCKSNSIIVSRDIIDKMVCSKDRRPSQLYRSWVHMLKRCYDPKSANYYLYGAKGVTVSDRWHSYMRYAKDCIIKLIHIENGFDRFLNKELVLDKDKLQMGVSKDKMVYSNETTIYLTPYENVMLANSNSMYPFKMIDAHTGLCKIVTNMSQCAKDNNIADSRIRYCLSGKNSYTSHYMFENLSESEMKDFDKGKLKEGDVTAGCDTSRYWNHPHNKPFMYKYENDNRWVITSGQSATGRKLKIIPQNINLCLHGICKTSCGYQFKYLTDEEIDLVAKNILCVGDTIVIDNFGNKHYYAGDYEINIKRSKSTRLTVDSDGYIIMRRA